LPELQGGDGYGTSMEGESFGIKELGRAWNSLILIAIDVTLSRERYGERLWLTLGFTDYDRRMLVLSYARENFIVALYFPFGWHHRSSYTYSFISYTTVRYKLFYPASRRLQVLQAFVRRICRSSPGVHQRLVYRSCRLNKVFGEPSLLGSVTTIILQLFLVVLCMSCRMYGSSGVGGW